MLEKRICKVSGHEFEVTDEDFAYYEKIGVPAPTVSPLERQRLRLLHCNEMKLYSRTCDLCKASILSMYGTNAPFPVYCQKCWWGDNWDPYIFGRDFDFSREFFPQFKELMNQVPHCTLNVTIQNCINSDYINYAGNAKNGYLIFDSDYTEDCYYSYAIQYSKFCSDCMKVGQSELCYECIDCLQCYNLQYSQNCRNCYDSYFLKNCIGCRNCYGCINLRHKEYHIYNKPVSKEEYQKFIASLGLDRWSVAQEERKKADEFFLKFPHKFMRGEQNEDVSGDSVFRSKNVHDSFDTYDSRDCKYLHSVSLGAQDCYDLYQFGENISQCYESAIVGYGAFRVMFCKDTWPQSSELYYSQDMRSCSNCFGCFGLKHGRYAIFNKKYEKDEYEILKQKIIEHMKKTDEFGEFFPALLSPFAYNETTAMDHFPLTKEEALKRGFQWKDEDAKEYQKQTYQIPDSIKDVPDSITNEILACEATGKNFRIITQELAFCRKRNIPIPRYCFDERHRQRFNRRNPHKLFERKCDKCKMSILTAFSPNRKEPIYCEKCYLAVVY